MLQQQERKKPQSFSISPSTLALIKKYARNKKTTASMVVESLAAYYIPRLIEADKGKRRKTHDLSG